jgi:hypothetical protein
MDGLLLVENPCAIYAWSSAYDCLGQKLFVCPGHDRDKQKLLRVLRASVVIILFWTGMRVNTDEKNDR